MGAKRHLIHTLKLWRERGDGLEVAETLGSLSDMNRLLDLPEEGIQQAKDALEICEQLNDTFRQARSLFFLAWLLRDDEQLGAGEEAALQSISLLPGKIDRPIVCQCHRLLGQIYSSKGEADKAIDHFEVALRIASSLDWHAEQFWGHYDLAELSFNQGRSDDSHAHVEHAKSCAGNNTYLTGRAIHLQARLWYDQGRLTEARLEALCAVDVYEKVGATVDLEACRDLLRGIEQEMEEPIISGGSDFNGELPDTALLPTHINLLF